MEASKQFWKSKTFWAALLTAVLPVVPPVGLWIAANAEAYSAILSVVFAALRVTTSSPVTLTKKA